jgi:feruloyl esterase
MKQTSRNRVLGHLSMGLAIAVLSACGGSDDSDPSPAPTPVDSQVSAEQACARLQGKLAGGAAVTAAAVVPATAALPGHCKVSALIAPRLNMELRLPNDWNGKLLYGGGGGYNGSIPAADRAALTAGYAHVASDSGHQAGGLDASFALNDPYAAFLFGSGSVPTVAAAAREMLRLAYSRTPERSYFEGCSNGGREGLMAAQRSPNLFDGIIARAPAYNWVGLFGHFNVTAKALAAPGAALSPAKVALLSRAVRAACDDKDGIVDGVVSNPAACAFDPAVLACVGGTDSGDTCLSTAQLAVVNAWTAPVGFSGGTYTNPGWSLTGNEEDPGAWTAWLTGSTGNGTGAARTLFQDTTVKNYLARDPNANSLTYVWDSNPAAIYGMAALNEANNPDLRPFINGGGKLILWHGGNDPAISYKGTAEYYQRVGQVVGRTALDQFARFYVAPGVNHCSGGPGADSVDLLTSLDAWVTKGTAPGQLTTAKLNADRSTAFDRPLCAYPRYARYSGPANDANAAKLAQNYTCTAS